MISIIVPVYNTEKYLNECIDSILSQTYDDFELLLINDGSTDKSLEILREYETKDSRVKVFDKKNAGQSSARNMGLDNAKGEYIAFIDSDDIVAQNYLQVLFSALVDTKAQMVQSKIARFNDVPLFENESIGYIDFTSFSSCYDNLKYVNCYNDSVSCKLYSKVLFEDLRFAEGEIFEDGKIIIELLLKSKFQINVDYCGYYYRCTPNSTITTYNAKKDYEQIVVWEKRKQIYIDLHYQNHIKEIDSRIIKVLIKQYYNAKINKENKEILSKLKYKIYEYMPTIKKNKFIIGWKDKFVINICKLSPDLYVFLRKTIKQFRKS